MIPLWIQTKVPMEDWCLQWKIRHRWVVIERENPPRREERILEERILEERILEERKLKERKLKERKLEEDVKFSLTFCFFL